MALRFLQNRATVFRGMVAVSALAYLIGAALPFLPLPLYTERQLDLLLLQGEGALIPNTLEYWALLSVIQLVLCVGVFRWSARARDLLALLVAYQVFSTPLLGVVVGLPYENYFYSLSWLLMGGALALAYFSELEPRFE